MASAKMLTIGPASTLEPHNRKKRSRLVMVAKWLGLLLISIILMCLVLVTVNHWRTAYTITSTGTGEDIHYQHEDERTTNIVNYLTGEGEFPKEERLPVYRQYVKNMLEEAKMTVPDDIYTMEYPELNALAIKWYKIKYPKHRKSKESLEQLIENLFEKAVRPPLEGFGPDVDGKIWRLLIDVGSPKVRWMEEQDELPARFVAYSAGDKKSFYDPTGNTIYIAYNNSVRELLNEVGHAKQFRERQLNSWTRLLLSSLISITEAGGDPKEFFNCYKSVYKDPQSFEGEAHGIIKETLLEKHGLLIVNKEAPSKQLSPTPDPNPRTCGGSF